MVDLGMSLENYLRSNDVWYRFIRKPETIHTADAAKAAGLDLSRLTKNLVSVTDQGEYVVLIVPGNKRVHLKKAALILNVKNVRLVPFEEADKISGYPPGGTPSVGFKKKIRVIIDKSLLNYDTLFCGGGSRDLLVELKVEDVIRLNNAISADISK